MPKAHQKIMIAKPRFIWLDILTLQPYRDANFPTKIFRFSLLVNTMYHENSLLAIRRIC